MSTFFFGGGGHELIHSSMFRYEGYIITCIYKQTCVYVNIYTSGLLKVREPGNRVPSHLAKVAARNH